MAHASLDSAFLVRLQELMVEVAQPGTDARPGASLLGPSVMAGASHFRTVSLTWESSGQSPHRNA